MYSIILKVNSASDKYSYYLNNDGTVYVTDSLETLGKKVTELLGTYTLPQIVPIKNCIITTTIDVQEATAE